MLPKRRTFGKRKVSGQAIKTPHTKKQTDEH